MVKFILLTSFVLISIINLSVQAGDLDHRKERPKNTGQLIIPIIPPPDLPSKKDLLPVEEVFKNRCIQEGVKVNWEEVRKALYGVVIYGTSVFRGRVRDYTNLPHDVIDDLGPEKLYEEYLDLFRCYPPKDLEAQQPEGLKDLVHLILDSAFTEHKDKNSHDKSAFDLPITDDEMGNETDSDESSGHSAKDTDTDTYSDEDDGQQEATPLLRKRPPRPTS